MLCQFSFENFKSYRDETVLDMQATNIEEFSDSLILSPNPDKFSNILPVAAIYGPNGGGKSVLLEALVSLISKVLLPIKSANAKKVSPFTALIDSGLPFALNQTSKKEPTSYKIYFRTDLAEFRYELSAFGNVIINESLYRTKLNTRRITPVMIFERTRNEPTKLGSTLKRAGVLLPKQFNDSLPMLSFAYYSYNIPEINEAVEWFMKCLAINYSRSKLESLVTIYEDGEEEQKSLFLSLLSKFGVPIQDYGEEEVKIGNITYSDMYTIHEVGGERYRLPIYSESQGTLKLFNLLPLAICALQSGGVAIVDELDAKLHPQLLRAVIRLFTNPETNPNHAQLIFVSQDVSTMRSEFLRRDEIWFAARDDESVSRLWSLYDLQDARGERVKTNVAYDKQYLEGRYGADPYLKQMMDWRVPNAQMSEKAKEE